jgi:3-hydroxyisobutyrate dehydrogenase-like beta-hydroxyacid dehydrogenase
VIVGLVHPGEMGAAIGNALVAAGHDVLWASDGRSAATRARAERFTDAGTIAELAARSEVVVSVVPPHAAVDVAASFDEFDGIYVDANAIAPETAQSLGVRRLVDGGIVGGPPAPRIYLSGDEAASAAALFDGSPVEALVVRDASAVKAAYASWTKVTAALLLAVRDYARARGIEAALRAEWERTQPGLADRLAAAERSAEAKGWRWIGEMEELGRAFEAAGLPDGFHTAAASIYGVRRRADQRIQ